MLLHILGSETTLWNWHRSPTDLKLLTVNQFSENKVLNADLVLENKKPIK